MTAVFCDWLTEISTFSNRGREKTEMVKAMMAFKVIFFISSICGLSFIAEYLQKERKKGKEKIGRTKEAIWKLPFGFVYILVNMNESLITILVKCELLRNMCEQVSQIIQ